MTWVVKKRSAFLFQDCHRHHQFSPGLLHFPHLHLQKEYDQTGEWDCMLPTKKHQWHYLLIEILLVMIMIGRGRRRVIVSRCYNCSQGQQIDMWTLMLQVVEILWLQDRCSNPLHFRLLDDLCNKAQVQFVLVSSWLSFMYLYRFVPTGNRTCVAWRNCLVPHVPRHPPDRPSTTPLPSPRPSIDPASPTHPSAPSRVRSHSTQPPPQG